MQGHVLVTPARWSHVPALSRLIRDSRRKRNMVAAGAILWAPRWSPSLGLLQSVWPPTFPGMLGPRSLVAEEGGRPIGLAQMRPRKEPRHWEVVYLAVAGPPVAAASDLDGSAGKVCLIPDRRATRLLGELCDAAVLAGGDRLFARIPDGSGAYEVFRQVGFTPVVREYTFFRALPLSPPVEAIPPAWIEGLRPQRRADAFGLAQLYRECTPKMVQMAEGKAEGQASRHWERRAHDIGRRLTRQPRTQYWVVERNGRIAAWLQVVTQRRGAHQLCAMVDERLAGLAEEVIRFGLGLAARHPAPGVAIRVREHQTRLLAAVEGAGFEPIDSSLLMVKQLAARVMQRRLAPALEKVV
jgi:hypothetical protein